MRLHPPPVRPGDGNHRSGIQGRGQDYSALQVDPVNESGTGGGLLEGNCRSTGKRECRALSGDWRTPNGPDRRDPYPAPPGKDHLESAPETAATVVCQAPAKQ